MFLKMLYIIGIVIKTIYINKVCNLSKFDKTKVDKQIAASIKRFSSLAKEGSTLNKQFIEMPEYIHHKAELISAHLLLPSGAKIIYMGCSSGEVAYVLAQLNPLSDIIGIDHDESALEFAKENYRLDNLAFVKSDISIPKFKDGSIDGIVNSNILHGVYSNSGYNFHVINDLLENQIKKLKLGGVMLIRDYLMPTDDDFVLLEFPDIPSKGKSVKDLSDADLLILFSQSARPLPSGGCEGFFIDELKPKREGTRLFRLMHDWAIEFIHRKDERENWDKERKEEYTFFNYDDYRKEFAKIGMRMIFSAPYWNPWVIKNRFNGRFQLYNKNYEPMIYPATNYFMVAQKVGEKQSLLLEERRTSQKPIESIKIVTVRDKKSGEIHELVKRPQEYCDIIPFRITSDNRLVIFVRSGYPRPIVNVVSRGGHNLDGKKWSGHLIEPITMDTYDMVENIETNRRIIFDYVETYAGLNPKDEERWYVGETYFPSPDRIDEAIDPVFIEVENSYKTSWSIEKGKDNILFSEPGMIVELDAVDIILASQVGLLPEPRLEMHILDLMMKYDMPLPTWIGEEKPKLPARAIRVKSPEDILKEVEPLEFDDEKNEAINLKAVNAVFVEEGRAGHATRGMSVKDVEFVMTEDGIENIAVVLPLSRDWDNNLLVSLEPKVMPVPSRVGGDGVMFNAPSFLLPNNIDSVETAKAFVADKFNIPLEHVGSLGGSYFTHVGVTPQRIYPFTITSPKTVEYNEGAKYMMVKGLRDLGGFERLSGETLKAIARVSMQIDRNYSMSKRNEMDNKKYKDFSLSTEKVFIDAKGNRGTSVPSRVLGQRKPKSLKAKLKHSGKRVSNRLSKSYAKTKVKVKGSFSTKETKVKLDNKPKPPSNNR